MQDPGPSDPAVPNGRKLHLLSPTLLGRIIATIQTPKWPIRDAAIKTFAWADVGFDPDSISKLRWGNCEWLLPGHVSLWDVPGVGEVQLPIEATEWLVGWERAHGDCDDDRFVFYSFASHNRPKMGAQMNPADILAIIGNGLPLHHIPDLTPTDYRDISAILLASTAMPLRDARQVSELRWGEAVHRLTLDSYRPFSMELTVALDAWYRSWGEPMGMRVPRRDDPVFIPTNQNSIRWHHEPGDSSSKPLPMSFRSFKAIWQRRGAAIGFADVDPEAKLFEKHHRPTEEPY